MSPPPLGGEFSRALADAVKQWRLEQPPEWAALQVAPFLSHLGWALGPGAENEGWTRAIRK
eukprot:4376939-Pyramimonas_sp.AAC.1